MYEAEFKKRNPTNANGKFKGKEKKVDIKKLGWSKLKIPEIEYTVKAKKPNQKDAKRQSR